MGFYIEVPFSTKKAEQIRDIHNAEIIPQPTEFKVPEGKALICVVQNGYFDAAAFCHDEREFREFTLPTDRDPRPKKWLLMDYTTAYKISGKEEYDNK